MNIQNVLLKVWRAIRDFVARHIDSGVARESKKASCAALRSNASKNASKNVSKSSFIKSSKNASRKACGSCTSRANRPRACRNIVLHVSGCVNAVE